MRLVQISDTHFGTEVPAVVDALHAAIAALDPQVVLLCGDITQRARRNQFDAARRFVDALPPRAARIVIPGNHDLPLFNLWARARTPYAGYERALGPRESLWSADDVCVLALDATHPSRHTDGALPPAHLRDMLARAQASRSPDGLLIVAAHQPLWTAWVQDRSEVLIGRDETLRLLAQARVDVVLSGHVHVPLIDSSAIVAPELPWQFVLSGSGTATSHRTRTGVPNSFNVIDRDDHGFVVAQHDYAAGGFRQVATRAWRRASPGWIPAG